MTSSSELGKLSALDTDNDLDVYDAHVCTSSSPCLTYTHTETSRCTSESACKAPLAPQPAIFGAPASQTFSGPGNLAPTPAPAPPHKTAEEIRIEHLNNALKACRARKSKHKRKACEKAARKKYGAKKKAKAGPKDKAKILIPSHRSKK